MTNIKWNKILMVIDKEFKRIFKLKEKEIANKVLVDVQKKGIKYTKKKWLKLKEKKEMKKDKKMEMIQGFVDDYNEGNLDLLDCLLGVATIIGRETARQIFEEIENNFLLLQSKSRGLKMLEKLKKRWLK